MNIMKKHGRARFREASCFVAGVLIGLSIVTPVLAEAGTPPPILHTLAMLGSIVFFSFGLLLKAMATAQPPRGLGPQASCGS